MIDIIIPVYNTPIKDFERCLNSVESQTFKDYMVYIINDGSTNNIKEYLDNYCSKNPKIIVKHIENRGVSNARNIGLEISNNEYIAFVDADDTLNQSFLQEAYELITENNLDLIIGGYNEIVNGSIKKSRICTPGLHIYEKNNIVNFFEKLLSSKTNEDNKEIGDCPTGRIYTRLFKRSTLKELRFNTDVHMSEDTLFMIDYTYLVNKIGIVDKKWYNYHINEYSISNGTKKEKLIKNVNIFITEIINRQSKETNQRIKNAYKERIEKATKYIKELEKSN